MARPGKTGKVASATSLKTPAKRTAKAAPAKPNFVAPAPAEEPPVYTAALPEALSALTVEPGTVPTPVAEPAAPAPHSEVVKEAAAEMESQTAAITEKANAEGTELMVDAIETTKKYAEEAKAKFEATFADLSEKAKATMEKSSKAFDDITELTKGNVEALVESGKIAAKGVETMSQEAAEYGRLSFEKATATLKSLAAVKTPAEFFQLHSELLTSGFDSLAKETAKNSEALLKLVGEVAQPISNRVSIVTEKVKSIAA